MPSESSRGGPIGTSKGGKFRAAKGTGGVRKLKGTKARIPFLGGFQKRMPKNNRPAPGTNRNKVMAKRGGGAKLAPMKKKKGKKK